VRDTPTNLAPGFALRDGNYVSARWPGDAHRFAHDFGALLQAAPVTAAPIQAEAPRMRVNAESR
jgi:hypothetical protein